MTKELKIPYNGPKPIVMIGNWQSDVKMLTSPEDKAEWERRIEAYTGTKINADEWIAGGGSCCGGDSDGMSDM